ncbi:tyrosine-type recombinase/integrase [Vibrio brasiliensis]|uniref:Phage integrase family protein n=1 Tax=Vibrio brasiliensis LMG 20546 TaxID=945543 RepID=E8LZM4_9VIBR|nr:tyrosine-type recombinase/integrase [Vibrio brasiliensis]EGA63909.1 phage integrase family protein [Vibrio brasiliensis LMG 20546]
MVSGINFTKRMLENLELPKKRTRYADIGGTNSVRGLGLDVTPSGDKTFRYVQKVNGRNVKVTIGKFPEITVELARSHARDIAQQIAGGINPNVEKRKKRNADTFNDLFTIYEELFKLDIKAGKRRESSLTSSKTLYRLHLKAKVGNTPIDNFTKADAKQLLNRILSEKGYSLHNHTLTLLKSMFNRADVPTNPFGTLKKIDESYHRRQRTLSPEELQRLFKSLDQEQEVYQDCVLLLLLTGQRKATVLSMEWREINRENQTWSIPTSKIKSKKPHVVPLTSEAMAILERRAKSSPRGEEFVFPSRRSQSGHITDKSGKGGFWRRITERAGLYNSDPEKNLQVHDLRRTLATYQVSSGGSLQATSKLLGHSNVSITSDVYAHLSVDIVRQELEQTTNYMLGGQESSDLDKLKQEISSLNPEDKQQLLEFLSKELSHSRFNN